MEILLSILGAVLAFGAVVIIARTMMRWQGMFRRELFFMMAGFLLVSFGFLVRVFAFFQSVSSFDVGLFALGMALLFLGSSRIFTFSHQS